jgi:hypothetical protein
MKDRVLRSVFVSALLLATVPLAPPCKESVRAAYYLQ